MIGIIKYISGTWRVGVEEKSEIFIDLNFSFTSEHQVWVIQPSLVGTTLGKIQKCKNAASKNGRDASHSSGFYIFWQKVKVMPK